MILGKIESHRDLSTNVKTSFEPNFRRLEDECGDRRRRENGVQMPEVRRFHGNRYFGVAVYHTLATERITLNFGVIMH